MLQRIPPVFSELPLPSTAISAAPGSNGTWICTTGSVGTTGFADTTGSVVSTIPFVGATGCVTSTGSIGSGGGGFEPSTQGEYDDLVHTSGHAENPEDTPPPRKEQKGKMYARTPYNHSSNTYALLYKKDLRGVA